MLNSIAFPNNQQDQKVDGERILKKIGYKVKNVTKNLLTL
jgi:hypothetical protein